MNEDDRLSIKISIADRYYPLKIVREEEEIIRAAAHRINQRIETFRVRYSGQDTQDALSMAALQFVVALMHLEQEKESSEVLDEIKNLDALLGEYLKQ